MAKTCKYYKQQRQVSYDGGQTWQNVSPAEYQKGELYESESSSCGYDVQTVFTFGDGTNYKSPTLASGSGVYEVSMISTSGGSPINYSVEETCGWISDSYSATPTSFKFAYSANTSTSSRSCRITLRQNSTHATCAMDVSQNAAGTSGETYLRWGWAGHYESYSANTAYNSPLLLVPIESKLNGANANAIVSSSADWVITNSPSYINGNEFAPDVNQYLYFQENETSSARTATVTFTQKGSTNAITLVVTQGAYVANCTITAYSLDNSEVCIGDWLGYTFNVADTKCSERFSFTLYDASGHSTSSTIQASGGGGGAAFTTSNLSAGNGVVNVSIDGTPQNFYVTLKDCSQPDPPEPEVTDFNYYVNIHNTTSSPIYPNQIVVYNNNLPITISLGNSNTIVPGGWGAYTRTVSKYLNNVEYDRIELKDTAHSITYTITWTGGTILYEGATVAIEVLGT